MEARDAYQRFTQMGHENLTVFAKLPHVRKVHVFMAGNNTCEEFECNCSRKKVNLGV
jgi:hypothetical protein